ASAAYDQLIADDERALFGLRQQCDTLEAERRRLLAATRAQAQRMVPRPEASSYRSPEARQQWRPPSPLAAPRAPNHEAILAVRRQFKRIVNRWAYTWQLEPAVQGQINQIADDPDRPLGEALVLLDWERVYMERLHVGESEADHLARLES